MRDIALLVWEVFEDGLGGDVDINCFGNDSGSKCHADNAESGHDF